MRACTCAGSSAGDTKVKEVWRTQHTHARGRGLPLHATCTVVLSNGAAIPVFGFGAAGAFGDWGYATNTRTAAATAAFAPENVGAALRSTRAGPCAAARRSVAPAFRARRRGASVLINGREAKRRPRPCQVPHVQASGAHQRPSGWALARMSMPHLAQPRASNCHATQPCNSANWQYTESRPGLHVIKGAMWCRPHMLRTPLAAGSTCAT